MGSDLTAQEYDGLSLFQSTLPGWGATSWRLATTIRYKFQSTLPGWGATIFSGRFHSIVAISIHAPRMGSDYHRWRTRPHSSNFNPRSPDGERLNGMAGIIGGSLFQSTLPGWGATIFPDNMRYLGGISIHAPRMGSDFVKTDHQHAGRHFNPRSPDGERLRVQHGPVQRGPISIHAPRMGSDRENGHLRPRYGQNHPFSTLIVSQIVVDVLGTVRKSQKHQRTSHYEVIKQPERQK